MQGIGTGLVLPIMFAMVLEVIPLHKIGAAMGTSALVIMFAPAIGPTLAGTLVGAGSWRLVFGAGMASSYGWTSPVVLAALVAGAFRRGVCPAGGPFSISSS